MFFASTTIKIYIYIYRYMQKIFMSLFIHLYITQIACTLVYVRMRVYIYIHIYIYTYTCVCLYPYVHLLSKDLCCRNCKSRGWLEIRSSLGRDSARLCQSRRVVGPEKTREEPWALGRRICRLLQTVWSCVCCVLFFWGPGK